MTPVEKRLAVCMAAENAVGLAAVGPTREAYLDLIAKGETRARREEMAKMSGCALVVAGLWRVAGVRSPHLEAPYKTGSAISRLVSLARASEAMVAVSDVKMLRPGDMVLMGKNQPPRPRSDDRELLVAWEKACAQVLTTWGGGEHVFTVLSVDLQGGTVTSVDGGQLLPGGGPFAVRKVTRHFALRERDQLWFGGRRMVGLVVVDRLPFQNDDEVEIELDNA